MSAINGVSLGVLSAYAILNPETGKLVMIEDLLEQSGEAGSVTVENITDATAVGKNLLKAADADAVKEIVDVQDGATGPQGPKGDTGSAGAKGDTGATGPAGLGINTIAASRTDNTVTLTFTMSDNTTKTASFDLPAA